MNISIDVSPLSTGHKIRGTGFYLLHLKEALLKYFPENSYTFFTKETEIPNDTEVIHYPYFEPFLITLPLIKKYKTIVTVHDLTPILFHEHFPAGLKGGIKWQIQRFLLSKVDAIITDSQCSKKDIIKLIGVPENKVHVVYLAAGEEFKKISNVKYQISNVKNKYKLPEKFVLYVGDVTWNKNLPRLVEAVQRINIPLVMIGKALTETNFDRTNPWNKDRIKMNELVAEDKDIVRLGFIPTEDLILIYNMATVFAFPSLYEGFGLPLVEAMSCGIPVVTTKEGPLKEIGGNAVYYVDGYHVDSMAKGLQEVFTNKILQKILSEKGLLQSKNFSWKKAAKETTDVYKSVE